ncbi:MAG: hypothetical protein K0S33_3790 [Bacteroidetes bacterium]|jgi:hypothetical protein|nr:hypothetical protein [Bacteroidota bacterium]
MKTSKQLLPVALRSILSGLGLLLAFSSFRPAPDDPVVGFYVDGVKVTELTCYSFGNLTAVLPYNSNYDQFDEITINIYSSYKEEGSIWDGRTYKEINKAIRFKYVKGNYLVYEIYGNKEQYLASGFESPGDGGVWRYKLQHDGGLIKKKGQLLLITMHGNQITGSVEKYDPSCNCIIKQPTYNSELLHTLEIPLKNRSNKKWYEDPSGCPMTGTKVDFNNLGK